MKVVTNISVQFLKVGTKIQKQWLKPACNASLGYLSCFILNFTNGTKLTKAPHAQLNRDSHLQVLYKKLSWIIRRKAPMLEPLFTVSTRQRATLSKKAPVSSPFWIRVSSLTDVFSWEFCEIFLSIFFTEHFQSTVSEQVFFK